MTVLALRGSDTALIIIAAGWFVLVGFLSYVLLNTYNVLTSTKLVIDAMREETVPLLREVKTSVEKMNREIDTTLESVGVMVGRAEKLSGLIEEAAASPLVKVISFGAGLRKGVSKAKKKRTD
jgi:hypothetical protein